MSKVTWLLKQLNNTTQQWRYNRIVDGAVAPGRHQNRTAQKKPQQISAEDF